MKTRFLFIAAAILAAGLFASSCGKVDFLEGTSWSCDTDSEKSLVLTFYSKETCAMKKVSAEGEVTSSERGEYRGKKNVIAIDLSSGVKLTGTIDGDVMTLYWGANTPDETYKFKKKK